MVKGLKMSKELGCVEYLEIGAHTKQGLEKDMLDRLYTTYIKQEHEKQVEGREVKKKKKKKRFFFF